MKSKEILTSVKVDPEMFEDFKIMCVKLKFNFNKMTGRAMYLFLKDEAFRKQLLNQNNTDYEK